MQNPDVKGMIEDIHDSTVRLIDIVNDFLDTSRLEQGKMKFECAAMSLDSVIEKIIYEMAGLSRTKQVAITFDQTTLGQLPKSIRRRKPRDPGGLQRDRQCHEVQPKRVKWRSSVW